VPAIAVVTPLPGFGVTYKIDDQITPPRLVSGSNPGLPDRCTKSTVAGMPVLRAAIDQAGNVRDVRWIRVPTFDPPCPEYARYLREAVERLKYAPATRKGEPVAVELIITVHLL